MNPVKFPTLAVLSASSLLVLTPSIRADDVTDTIEEAVEAYQEKDYKGAAEALEIAVQMIREKRAAGLSQFLPDAPKGWEATDVDSSSGGAAFMGGMTSAAREYSKDDGASVKVQFMTDSPMLQSFMMMANMPMMGSAGGGKVERIKKQKAIVQYEADDMNGTINIVVENTLLVQIEGSDVTLADLRMFAEAIDYDELEDAL